MAWEYKVSTTKIGGSSLYAYVGVDWRVGSTRVTYDHMGGVTSPYGGWSNNPQATLYWREWDWGTSSWGVWHEYAQDSAHYSGPGDLPIVQTSGDFTRRSYNREVQLDCDVYATTSTGSGTGSAILFYIVPALPPAANTPTLIAPSDNSATLSWSNPSGTWQSIRVERSVDGGSYSELASISASATSYTDSTTTAGHVYRYRIRYYNENAYGAYGYSTWLVNTPPAPSAITAQAIQGSTNINVELENPATAADGIEWQISDDGGENWSASTRVAGTPTETPFVTPVTSFVAATNLGGTVRLRVRNYVDDDVDYFSDWLESGDITTICPPAAPTLISPVGVLDMADGSVTFTWRHNPLDGSSQTAAQLAYSTNGGSTWTTVTKSTEESHTITPIPWAAGTLVTWRVRTKGADANYGDWAQAVQFDVFTAPTLNITSPGATITGMPVNLTATYSDMAGYSCQAATVSLTKDGRTLYSESATIKGTSITSSLDVSEFLPTNRESYTVVLTARSSSGLSTSANATFTVDFVEPQAGELQITNDPDTGYVSLLATFDNSASEITYAGSTNEQYESSEGYVRSLTVEGKSEVQNGSLVSIEGVSVGDGTITTPLRSAGSVHDELVVQGTSAKKKVRIGELVVDGSENDWVDWTSSAVHADNKYYYRNTAYSDVDKTLYQQFINSWGFDYNSDYGTAVTTAGCFYFDSAKEPCFVVKKADYPTLADFKTALAANPFVLNYILQDVTEQSLPDTALIEVGSAFTVATDLGTTFEMTTWDGSADAVSISVSRVNADGTVTPLLTDGQSGAGIVDKYAPLNTDYQYAITTKAVSQAVKTVYVENIIETDLWFAYWTHTDGEIVTEMTASAKWNPDNGGIQVTRPQKTRVYYAGRRDPVSYDGHAVALTETPSWMFVGKDEVEPFFQLIEDGGRGVYKSCDGWVYHADFDLTMTPSYTAIGYYGGASLGITRIAGDKL